MLIYRTDNSLFFVIDPCICYLDVRVFSLQCWILLKSKGPRGSSGVIGLLQDASVLWCCSEIVNSSVVFPLIL